MAIPLKTWQEARSDYISGGGSVRAIAAGHGLRVATVEKRARRERWAKLRHERDDALRSGATPAPFPPPYSPPASSSEPLSDAWFEDKRRQYFLETQSLIEEARTKLKKNLENDGLDGDEIARLANALGTLAETETRVLGIRDARKEKPRP